MGGGGNRGKIHNSRASKKKLEFTIIEKRFDWGTQESSEEKGGPEKGSGGRLSKKGKERLRGGEPSSGRNVQEEQGGIGARGKRKNFSFWMTRTEREKKFLCRPEERGMRGGENRRKKLSRVKEGYKKNGSDTKIKKPLQKAD